MKISLISLEISLFLQNFLCWLLEKSVSWLLSCRSELKKSCLRFFRHVVCWHVVKRNSILHTFEEIQTFSTREFQFSITGTCFLREKFPLQTKFFSSSKSSEEIFFVCWKSLLSRNVSRENFHCWEISSAQCKNFHQEICCCWRNQFVFWKFAEEKFVIFKTCWTKVVQTILLHSFLSKTILLTCNLAEKWKSFLCAEKNFWTIHQKFLEELFAILQTCSL